MACVLVKSKALSKVITTTNANSELVLTSTHIKPRIDANYVPEPYKVSTITAIGSLNTEIDLSLLFNNLPILDPGDRMNNGFTFAEFGRKHGVVNHRGDHKKIALAAKRPPPKTRRFDNQVTVVYRKRISTAQPPLDFKDNFQYVEEDEGQMVTANMKIFNNGNVQITGLKYINHGQEFIETMIETLRLLNTLGVAAAKTPDTMHASNYSVQLINTDFRVGFDIKREKLYKVLLDHYGMYTTYEPCIYPGVKIHFKWNTNQTADKRGCCTCTGVCKGKGTGDGDGECKRVTIAVFQSGCIIITGAQTAQQIEYAYSFINRVIKTHFREVYKPSIEECIAQLKSNTSDMQGIQGIQGIPKLPAPEKKLALPNKSTPKPLALPNKSEVLALTHQPAPTEVFIKGSSASPPRSEKLATSY